jgi:putative glycosyltransferase (TIGR04372 family)
LVEKFFGIKKGDKYVCIIVRDKAYLKKNSYNQSWSYHDYRNSNIYSYLPACDYLTKEGYKVIRMGNVVEKKLLTKNKNIIDYGGSKYISDLLDIYLMSNCEFVISSGTGLDAIAKICRKPMIFANFVPLGAFNYSANLTYLIFKKYYNVKINRLMTLSEIFLNGSAYYFTSNDFRKNKIKLIDNTQDEILGVVKDFIKNQKQRKKITRLNKNFWKLYYKFRMNAKNDTYRTSYRLNFTIGESFLRKYNAYMFHL